jgi:hypothetical protein
MPRHRRVLLVVAGLLVVGIVAALGVTVAVGIPALLGVLGVIAVAVGLLSPSLRRNTSQTLDSTQAPMQSVPAKTAQAPGSPERPWTMQWASLPPPGTIAGVRTRVAGELADGGLHGDHADAVLLVVTELLSNAVEHGRAPVRIQVTAASATVHIEVHDAGPGTPQTQPLWAHRLRGRGLLVVEALSSGWGWTGDPTGTIVWADIPAGRDP